MAADRTKFREAVRELASQGGLTVPQIQRHVRSAMSEARSALSVQDYTRAYEELAFSIVLVNMLGSKP